MHTETQVFLARLNGVRSIRSGGGEAWQAHCPCHADEHPSYEVKEGDRGIVSLCRSCGATHVDACAALGVDIQTTFWPEHRREQADWRDGIAPTPRPAAPAPRATDRGAGPGTPTPPASVTGSGRVVARHVYRDAEGNVLYRMVREHIPDTRPNAKKPYRKALKAERFEGGKWIGALDPNGARVIYYLPEIIATPREDRVLWVEGENKAEALMALGIAATTAMGGTGQARQLPDLSPLAGREVWILPDDDEPGRHYALCVRDALHGIAGSVHIAPDLPGLREIQPTAGDVIDWLRAGHTAEELLGLLVKPRSPVWQWAKTRAELRNTKSPLWMVDQLFQEQALILLYGAYAQGKSFISFDLAMSICCLQRWFGREVRLNGPVVYINADGGPGIADRLRGWEAVNPETEGHELWTVGAGLLLSGNGMNDFHRFLSELPERPVMLVFDTLSQCVAGADENQQGEMSMFIHNVQTLQREFECAAMLVHHANASGRGPRGSTVIPGAADTVWRCQWSDDSINVICEKQRNGPRFDPMWFKLRRITQAQSVLISNDHPTTRQERIMQSTRILAVIAEQPGITVDEIIETTGFSERNVRGHIDLLERAEEIAPQKLNDADRRRGPKAMGYWLNRKDDGPWSTDQRLR